MAHNDLGDPDEIAIGTLQLESSLLQSAIKSTQKRKTELTDEVKEIFNDVDINFRKVLRELSSCFDPDATIHDVAVAYEDFLLPTKTINGKTYKAGYKGVDIIPSGKHNAFLGDIKQHGSLVKLMFIVNSQYVFQTLKEYKAEDIVNYSKNMFLGNIFRITVEHETIENTGIIHAVVNSSRVFVAE